MFDDNFFLIMGTIFIAMFINSKSKKENFSQNGGGLLNVYDEE